MPHRHSTKRCLGFPYLASSMVLVTVPVTHTKPPKSHLAPNVLRWVPHSKHESQGLAPQQLSLAFVVDPRKNGILRTMKLSFIGLILRLGVIPPCTDLLECFQRLVRTSNINRCHSSSWFYTIFLIVVIVSSLWDSPWLCSAIVP